MTGHKIQNLSPIPRAGWADLAIPFAEGERLAPGGPLGVLGRWVKGRALGTHSRMVHVYGPPTDVVTIPNTAAFTPGPVPAFAASDWVTDDMGGLMPLPRVFLASAPDVGHVIADPKLTRIDDNAARQLWHVHGRVGASGFVYDAYLGVYSGQDVVELSGALTWSDPSTLDLDRAISRIELTCGEILWLDYAKAMGFYNHILGLPGTALLGTRAFTVGNGQMIPFFGAVLCTPEIPIPALVQAAGADPALLARLMPLVARLGGRIEAMGEFDGSWLCFGQTPDTGPSDDADLAQLLERAAAIFDGNGFVFDARPLGQTPQSSRTGDQEDFGACKGITTTLKDPRIMPLLRYSVSEPMRPCHYREAQGSALLLNPPPEDGAPIRVEDHPDWVSWDGVTHYHPNVSPDRLGKPQWWPSFETNGYSGKDGQHDSMNRLAEEYALTGDPVFELCIRDEIELCLGRAKNSINSPRGQGRGIQSLAQAWLLTDDPRALTRINELAQWALEQKMPAGDWRDPANPMQVVGTVMGQNALVDPVEGPVECVAVWEHTLAMLGYFAAYRALQSRGKTLSEGLATVPWILTKTVAFQGFYSPGGSGFTPLTHLRWLDGRAVPAEKYGEPGFTKEGGINLGWFMGGVTAAHHLMADGDAGPFHDVAEAESLRARLAAIVAADTHPNTARDREWRATKARRA